MKKQKIFIVLGIFVIIIATVAGIFLFRNIHGNINDTVVTNSEEGDVTRYQWLEMLCTHAGITEYTSETPYFEDVLPDNKYFSYIQSATEWEILNTGSFFEGSRKIASGKGSYLRKLQGRERLRKMLRNMLAYRLNSIFLGLLNPDQQAVNNIADMTGKGSFLCISSFGTQANARIHFPYYSAVQWKNTGASQFIDVRI